MPLLKGEGTGRGETVYIEGGRVYLLCFFFYYVRAYLFSFAVFFENVSFFLFYNFSEMPPTFSEYLFISSWLYNKTKDTEQRISMYTINAHTPY